MATKKINKEQLIEMIQKLVKEEKQALVVKEVKKEVKKQQTVKKVSLKEFKEMVRKEIKKAIKEAGDKKWIQKAVSPETKGALHKTLGIPQDEKIPTSKLEDEKSKLHKKAEKGELSPGEKKEQERVNFALNVRK